MSVDPTNPEERDRPDDALIDLSETREKYEKTHPERKSDRLENLRVFFWLLLVVSILIILYLLNIKLGLHVDSPL